MSFSLTLKFNAAEAIAIDCLLRNFERKLGSKKVLVPGLAVGRGSGCATVRLFYNIITR